MTVKFRQNLAVPTAALVALFGASAVALQRWWLVPILIAPLVVLWWGLRSGVDVDAVTLRIRGLTGARTVPWTDVAGLRVEGRRVFVTLTSGAELPLPAVTPHDVPRLIAASGGELRTS